MLGAIAAKTDRIGLATGVTCPTVRYHPAIIAQAAATLASSPTAGSPSASAPASGSTSTWSAMASPACASGTSVLREALEIIRLLWQGGYQSYDGKHLQLEDARVFDLPEPLPLIAVAASGRAVGAARRRAGRRPVRDRAEAGHHRGLPRRGRFRPALRRGTAGVGAGRETAAEAVLETTRWALTGWKVMSELPNPVNFDAATHHRARPRTCRASSPCGPDAGAALVEVAKQFTDAGFDRIALLNAGPDPDGFIDFFRSTLAPRLRALTGGR